MAFLFVQRLIIAITYIVSHRGIEQFLKLMARRPRHRDQLGVPGFEERLALTVRGFALFGADDIGCDALTGDGFDIGKGRRVEQRDQAMKGVGLALVGRGREQEQVGRGFGQALAQPVAGDLIGAATQPMGFINNDQIPAGGD